MSDAVAIAMVTAVCTATPIVVGQVLTFLATRKATVKAAATVAEKVQEVAVVALGQDSKLGEIKALVNGHATAQAEKIDRLERALAASLKREQGDA